MRLVIDRFEGEYAICEKDDRNMQSVLRSHLPEGIHEGSCLQYNGIAYTIDEAAEKVTRERIKKKMDSLWE